MQSYRNLDLERKRRQLTRPVNYRDFRETGPWASGFIVEKNWGLLETMFRDVGAGGDWGFSSSHLFLENIDFLRGKSPQPPHSIPLVIPESAPPPIPPPPLALEKNVPPPLMFRLVCFLFCVFVIIIFVSVSSLNTLKYMVSKNIGDSRPLCCLPYRIYTCRKQKVR